MGVYDGYYLYSDMDGTLLDDDKRVSEENRAAIHSFVEQGGRFGLATGRVPSILRSVENDLPINAPCILYNGGGLYDLSTRTFLAKHPLLYDLAAEVISCVISSRANACVQVFTDLAIFEVNANQRDDPQTVLEQIPIRTVPLERIEGTIIKLLIAHETADLNEIHAAVRLAPFFPQLTVFRSSDHYLEIVASNVNKGSALSDVRSRCDNVKKILAIGDYNNDLEMVRYADIGAAPANAIDEVKSAADIVLPADNNHHCVAQFLNTVL